MFFLLYRQKDIDKITEGNYRNYVIDKLTCEFMENKTLESRMLFLWILRVVYFPVKHSYPYNKYIYFLFSISLFMEQFVSVVLQGEGGYILWVYEWNYHAWFKFKLLIN